MWAPTLSSLVHHVKIKCRLGEPQAWSPDLTWPITAPSAQSPVREVKRHAIAGCTDRQLDRFELDSTAPTVQPVMPRRGYVPIQSGCALSKTGCDKKRCLLFSSSLRRRTVSSVRIIAAIACGQSRNGRPVQVCVDYHRASVAAH